LRKRSRVTPAVRNKSFSFLYYFVVNNKMIRVCKSFYLSTLNISQRRTSYFHQTKKRGITSTPEGDKRKGGKERIGPETRQAIRDHINMFERMPSHYCRKDTQKEYLESTLTLQKMDGLYLENCTENNLQLAKKWLYEKIFNCEFNIVSQAKKRPLSDLR
jgi:hypothetical protein